MLGCPRKTMKANLLFTSAMQTEKDATRPNQERPKRRSSFLQKNPLRFFRLHPLFLAVGVWYAFTGELFLFLISTLVAVQHECAHAFAAAKLGYKLRTIVLMPFGAVIDGDIRGISFKDELYVAFCGPLCNLLTAVFFVALWWFMPTMYAFTDTAFYASLSIGIINLLPAYPLDGGRILQCSLACLFSKKEAQQAKAERKAELFSRFLGLLFSSALLLVFFVQCAHNKPNLTLLAFSLFLFFGALGSKEKTAVYEKIDFSFCPSLERGVEVRHVAILDTCPIKDVFRFFTQRSYLILEVYDKKGQHLFNLPQNLLAELFFASTTPYEKVSDLYSRLQQKSAGQVCVE